MTEMEAIRMKAMLWHLVNSLTTGSGFDPGGCPECEEIKEFLDAPDTSHEESGL